MKIAIQDIFLKLMFNISKYYLKFKMIYPIFPEKIKIEKVEKLVVNFHDKMEYVSNIGFFLDVYVQYTNELHEVHNDLHFLAPRMKIEKFEKFVANLYMQEV